MTVRKRRVCPICGAVAVPIVYGLVIPIAIEQAERGEIVLGGCEIFDDSLSWRCTREGCGHEFGASRFRDV